MNDSCCTPGCQDERELGSARCPACKQMPWIVWSEEVAPVVEIHLCYQCGGEFMVEIGIGSQSVPVDPYKCFCSELCQELWAIEDTERPAGTQMRVVNGRSR